MPSMFGGDSTSKDYAPHMYVGDHFIHNTGKNITVAGVHYYAGKTRAEILVAERWTDTQPKREPVPQEEIPAEVYDLFSPTAFVDQAEERRTIEQMVAG